VPESAALTMQSIKTEAVEPQAHSLGDGFQVRRALPSAQRRMVGPFIFFDEFGPTVFRAGEGVDARPHSHIGLATLSYLIEGNIVHRDSAGHIQSIAPGEVNRMTAGRGIVHSERTSIDARAAGGTMFGQQLWIALPRSHEETAPASLIMLRTCSQRLRVTAHPRPSLQARPSDVAHRSQFTPT
jgi:redox-sensitive bicupin YhaK (pirin superfamily)